MIKISHTRIVVTSINFVQYRPDLPNVSPPYHCVTQYDMDGFT